MRQWMCDPKILCRNHLLGEHAETHMLVGHIKRKRKINKYIEYNLVEPKKIKSRHDILAKELKNRGYNHRSPILKNPNISYLPKDQQKYKINTNASLKDLLKRCLECRANARRSCKRNNGKKRSSENE